MLRSIISIMAREQVEPLSLHVATVGPKAMLLSHLYCLLLKESYECSARMHAQTAPAQREQLRTRAELAARRAGDIARHLAIFGNAPCNVLLRSD
jgi:hypothetical protein